MARTTGIRTRHSRTCRTREGGTCNCDPSYEAWVYSKRDAKKLRKTFPTAAAARGWRTDAAKAVKDRQLRATSSRTLRAEVEDFLAGARDGSILSRRERPYKPAVVREYERALRLRVLPTLGNYKLSEVELADLIDLKERLQGEGVTGGTLRNSFVPLQAIYRRARMRGLVAIDPTIDLPLPTSNVRDRAATPEEADELLVALPELAQPLWATAFYAGLRRGELRALRVGNVDLDGEGRFRDRENRPILTPVLSIEHGWDDIEGEIAPKSVAGTRLVFIPEALRPYLAPLLSGRPAEAFVFGSDSAPFAPGVATRRFDRALDALDAERAKRQEPPIVRFGLHEARHSYVTWLDNAGVSDTRAKRYSGHADGGVHDAYKHLRAAQYAEDASTLDAYLAGITSGKVVALGARA
jgi:integrase